MTLEPVFREPAVPEPAPASPESPSQEATPRASASGEPASPVVSSAAPTPVEAGSPGSVPLIIVDGANVVGSVPDGWWRDRAGAAIRLRDKLAALPATGLPGIPPPVEVVLVVEGRARDIPQGPPGVRIARAAGSGDDEIIDGVRRERTPGPAPRRIVVITADRGLRDRATALGAEVRGPGSVPR